MTPDLSTLEFIDGTELLVKREDAILVREALRIQDENPEGRSSRISINDAGVVCFVEFRRLLSWSINEDQSISHLTSVFIFDLVNPSNTKVFFNRIHNPERNLEIFEKETLSSPMNKSVYYDVVHGINIDTEERELSRRLQDEVERLLNNDLNRYETIEIKGLLFRSNAHVFRDMESIEKSIKLSKKLQLSLELKFPNLSA